MTEYDPEALTDDDQMTFGKFKDFCLGDVPAWYLRWFLDQSWCDKYPKLVQYANAIDENEE